LHTDLDPAALQGYREGEVSYLEVVTSQTIQF